MGETDGPEWKLKIVGGCRGKDDERRVATLRALAAELGVKTSVEFHVDVSYEDVVRHLRGAVAGLHAMLDEHFGICVVEYQAAGAVAIAEAIVVRRAVSRFFFAGLGVESDFTRSPGTPLRGAFERRRRAMSRKCDRERERG